jgi:serine/threonine protein kinase/tetratricopeptide (TPR) repeat protein
MLTGELAGRYTVERELGRGGMATVYLADDQKHHRKVAVKVLRPEIGELLGADRFTREIRVAAALNHPHILPLYDSGEVDGLLFYVMPYVRGESLRQRLDREKQLPVGDVLRIAGQVAAALDHAHAHGLIHRDIKPENILLHEGEAMLADFGIALAESAPTLGPRLTAVGLALGTPAYMSPEQAAGDPDLDARSDVYSLACVLYELLAGEPPYTGPTVQAVMARRFTEPPPSIRRTRPLVPLSVDQSLTRALARAPADRFASAGELAMALSATETEPTRPPSVAVLPFLNLSADPENEYFADGITEDVIAQLVKIRSLKVISRGSVMPFKRRERSIREVAATLEVSSVLDGSVRRVGDRVRIVAQLIDGETEQHLWSQTYDRQLTDIFAIQTDVALQIATELKAELSPSERIRIGREPTQDLQAYQLYLQGRYWYTRYTEQGFLKGIEYYRRAIAADPGYAMAHVGVALAYAELAAGQGGGKIREDEAHEEARKSVATALTLDNALGEAHAVLALLMCVHDYDWAGSEREFRLALQLSPGSADIHDHYGWLCSALGRFDEALELTRRAQELDPLAHRADLATTLIRAGRYDEALQAALKGLEFEPDYARGRATLAWAYLMVDRADEGIAELRRAVELAPANSLYFAQLGEAYGLVGRFDEARQVLGKLQEMAGTQYVSPYHLAYVYTGLGELDRAMDLLEQAYDERAGSLYGVKGSFLFVPLRGHPRFQALLAKMNLA